jgi:hypothetical protein
MEKAENSSSYKYPIFMFFTRASLPQLEFYIRQFIGEKSPLVMRVVCRRDKDTGERIETPMTIVVMQMKSFRKIKKNEEFFKEKNIAFDYYNLEKAKKPNPERNEMHKIFIDLPHKFRAGECSDFLTGVLSTCVDSGLIKKTMFKKDISSAVYIPRKSRTDDSHNGYGYIQFNTDNTGSTDDEDMKTRIVLFFNVIEGIAWPERIQQDCSCVCSLCDSSGRVSSDDGQQVDEGQQEEQLLEPWHSFQQLGTTS